MDRKYEIKSFRKPTAKVWALSIALAFLAGCMGSYGNIQRSREVGRMFENLEILPDHIYYYSGSDAIPNALIGIHEKYSLKTRYWKRVNLDKGQLGIWLRLGMGSDGLIGTYPRGSYIYGPAGEKIGVWYSIFDGRVVRMLEDNQVEVYPPMSYPGQNERPSVERGAVDPLANPMEIGTAENTEPVSAALRSN